MDLAKKVDTSAVVAVFPPEEEGGELIVNQYIFLPGRNTRTPRTERANPMD
jgi:hypothetical protein